VLLSFEGFQILEGTSAEVLSTVTGWTLITHFRLEDSELIPPCIFLLIRTRVRILLVAIPQRQAPLQLWWRLVGQPHHIRPLFIRYFTFMGLLLVKGLQKSILSSRLGQNFHSPIHRFAYKWKVKLQCNYQYSLIISKQHLRLQALIR